MNLAQLNKLNVGNHVSYKGEPHEVIFKRRPYPPDFLPDKDGKMIERPDESLGIAFRSRETGKVFHLESNLNEKQVKDGKLVAYELPEYVL